MICNAACNAATHLAACVAVVTMLRDADSGKPTEISERADRRGNLSESADMARGMHQATQTQEHVLQGGGPTHDQAAYKPQPLDTDSLCSRSARI